MFSFIRSFFILKSPEKDSNQIPDPDQVEAYRDFMDYDGMGNQGRFPVDKNKTKR